MKRASLKYTKGKLACMFLVAAVFGGTVLGGAGFGGDVPAGQAKGADTRQSYLMPVGAAVGIHIQTKGLLVLGTAAVTDSDGNSVSPAQNAVEEGDYILEADGVCVQTAAQMTEAIRKCGGGKLSLTVLRDGQRLTKDIIPVKTGAGEYKTGIWVRDDTQGIGTLSFVDENNYFAALGHGITDVDTGQLVDMSDGGLYPSSVYAIIRGESGTPGEMVGNIIYGKNRQFGRVYKNTESGIYGRLSSELYAYDREKAIPAAGKNELHVGSAQLMCQIDGKIDSYDIKIQGIDYNGSSGNKDFVIQITDERLLSRTGGIVQGMSGSPVIQDNRLAGVLTHVFVNNPEKGYGIFIEDMLEH